MAGLSTSPTQKYKSAPSRPLTIEEATTYTSTRQVPRHALQSTYKYDRPSINPFDLSISKSFQHHRDFILAPSQNATTAINPTAQRPLESKARSARSFLTSTSTTLPNPNQPPPMSKQYLQSLPIAHRQTLANQRVYALIFHSLERDGGWLWWEKMFVDVERVERDFGRFCDLSARKDEKGQGGSGNGSGSGGGDRNVDVLGEEEEEVPEHERVRTENNKRIAAYVTRYLRMGLAE